MSNLILKILRQKVFEKLTNFIKLFVNILQNQF